MATKGIPKQEGSQRISKGFRSYDGLKYEHKRLETFIGWPLAWLKPETLVSEGFYYLRTKDYCACVFCRVIIGAWEEGDIPREEHKRHFKDCPFVRNEPVGNVPVQLIPVLLSYVISNPLRKQSSNGEEDIQVDTSSPHQTSPKRREFTDKRKREETFAEWPEEVEQRPSELAEAGFFSCRLSDHVRCFHCGNGVRNWEKGDKPWEIHARLYPECNYLLLMKGQMFIDEMRQKSLPKVETNVSEKEFDVLMELDIIKAALAMGFPRCNVRAALQKKLKETGDPFFSMEACTKAVRQNIYKETRQEFPYSGEVTKIYQRMIGEVVQSIGARRDPSIFIFPIVAPITTSASSFSSSNISSDCAASDIHPIPKRRKSDPEIFTSPAIDRPNSQTPTLASSSSSCSEENSSVATSTPSPAVSQAPLTDSNASGSSYSPGVLSSGTQNLVSSSNSTSEKQRSVQELTAELSKVREIHMCKVCMKAEMEIVFLPCTHMTSCSSCAETLTKCTVCHKDIKHSIKSIVS